MPMHNEAAMDRRGVLKLAATTSLLLASLPRPSFANSQIGAAMRRVRPSDPDWPTPAEWNRLKEMVAGRLIEIETPLKACAGNPDGPACQELLRNLRNPFFVGDNPWATRSTGWVDAWTSAPSVYAVAANSAADVSAAIKFAREHNLRLVIKGGGHSFHGTSNAPDSLLIWTRAMDDIALHDGFVPQGCSTPPQPAVSVGAGAIWLHVYDAVTSDAGALCKAAAARRSASRGLSKAAGSEASRRITVPPRPR